MEVIHERKQMVLLCDHCGHEIDSGATMRIVTTGKFDGYLRIATAEALLGAWEPHMSSPDRTNIVPQHFHEDCMP